MNKTARRSEAKARPSKTLTPVSNLPLDPTPLIGREHELRAVLDQLRNDQIRLLTFTGPAGIGKTRLALAAAKALANAFLHGARFVDLTPVDAAAVPAAIGQALGLMEAAGWSRNEQVLAHLRARHLLLLLDNFEHVLNASDYVSEIIGSCPRIKVLVTSREPLNLRWEYRYPVPRLALPDLRDADPGRFSQAPAVALFVDRAGAIRPDFSLRGDNVIAVAQLVTALGGLPLAIRIAAARCNVLSPEQMLTELRGPALLSAEETRDAPARQRTLRDAIEWSYARLSAEEQIAFRYLGVFVGGWRFASAEALLTPLELGRPALERVASLVNKSLIQAADGRRGEVRYRMPETIREYALERLETAHELEQVRRQHAVHFLGLAELAESEFRGPEQRKWLNRLDDEHDNLRGAMRWTADRGEVEFELRLGAALAHFWYARGHMNEGRVRLDEALARGSGAPAALRSRALEGAGALALWQGDHARARALLEECLGVATALGETPRAAHALTLLGYAAVFQGDAAGGLDLNERSLARYRAVGDTWGIAYASRNVGWTLLQMGNPAGAEPLLEDALTSFREIAATRNVAFTLSMLAEVKLEQADVEAAAAFSANGVSLAGELDDPTAVGDTVAMAALVVGGRGNVERAITLLAGVDALRDATGALPRARAWARLSSRQRRYAEVESAARARLGAHGYDDSIAQGRRMSTGELVDAALAGLAADPQQSRDSPGGRPARAGAVMLAEPLTEREREVLVLLAADASNAEIARELVLTVGTVKTHVHNILGKLGVDTRRKAAMKAGDLRLL
jgi:predicted ATPase/DNA-binding NarL/FixJ family response regulator